MGGSTKAIHDCIILELVLKALQMFVDMVLLFLSENKKQGALGFDVCWSGAQIVVNNALTNANPKYTHFFFYVVSVKI